MIITIQGYTCDCTPEEAAALIKKLEAKPVKPAEQVAPKVKAIKHPHKRWTDEERQILLENHDLDYKKISRLLPRHTTNAVKVKLYRLRRVLAQQNVSARPKAININSFFPSLRDFK